MPIPATYSGKICRFGTLVPILNMPPYWGTPTVGVIGVRTGVAPGAEVVAGGTVPVDVGLVVGGEPCCPQADSKRPATNIAANKAGTILFISYLLISENSQLVSRMLPQPIASLRKEAWLLKPTQDKVMVL